MPLKWQDYYDKTIAWQSTPSLLNCLTRCEHERALNAKTAIDLGCGTGRDTFKLLEHGWSVVAVDSQASAIETLVSRYKNMHHCNSKLQTMVAAFETITSLPKVQLINATYSLPFLAPINFHLFWSVITDAILPGGRFCGSFFGINDDWRTRPQTTFLCKQDIFSLFTHFEIEQHNEEEFEGIDLYGRTKHWHTHTIIAKKIS